jgi:hypothetical protein
VWRQGQNFLGWLAAGLLVACSSSPPAVDAAGPDTAAPVDAAAPEGDGPAAETQAAPDATVEEVGTFELARVPTDPALTRRLMPGGAGLVGGDSGCTSDRAATTDRWCAFSRAGADARTELWVIDVSQAAGTAVVCDGTSPACLRLTTDLFTGTSIWGPSHPSAHRFVGDTLVFHAAGANGKGEVYDGPIWAWRPGWAAARAITGPHALICSADPGHPLVLCLDNTTVEATGTSAFDRPILREMDLTAGSAADPTGPLPLASHVVNAVGDQAFRVRFSPDGKYLVFSSVDSAGGAETVRVLAVSDLGVAAPRTIITDAAEWEISRDGTKIYFLRGYDRSRGDQAAGLLAMADFPSGENVVELQRLIRGFERLGPGSDQDRGLLLTYEGAGKASSYALMADRGHPADLQILGTTVKGVQVASDVRHTLYFRDLHAAEFPSAFVLSHQDGTVCSLTQDYRAESYGAAFSDSGRSAFWIEYFRNGSESEEGWRAQPSGCGERVKWGDYVAWYILDGDDFVIFEGGDIGDTTTWLQYTSLAGPSTTPWPTAMVVREHPDPAVGVVKLEGGTFLVFSVSAGKPEDTGLFLHGPLKQ